MACWVSTLISILGALFIHPILLCIGFVIFILAVSSGLAHYTVYFMGSSITSTDFKEYRRIYKKDIKEKALMYHHYPLFLLMWISGKHRQLSNTVALWTHIKYYSKGAPFLIRENINYQESWGWYFVSKKDAVKLILKYPEVFYEK